MPEKQERKKPKRGEGSRLSPKLRRFADEFLKTGNATVSWTAAGFKSKNQNSAAASASLALRKTKVADYIRERQLSREIAIDQAQIADLIEIETHFTEQFRGAEFAQDIADMEKELDDLRKAIADLRVARLEMDKLPVTVETILKKSEISHSISKLTDNVLVHRKEIKKLRQKQQDTRNKAAETLARMKGAFDPRMPATADVGKTLNAALRRMIQSKVRPPAALEDWKRHAIDVPFRTGDDRPPSDAAPGSSGPVPRHVLFTRENTGPKPR